MTSGGRFLTLLVLLACMVQLYECLPGFKKKEETEEEKRWRAAKMAYKRLFVWSDKLTTEEILEGVEALSHYKNEFKFDLDIDELMAIQEPKEELCDSREHVVNLQHLVKTTKKNHKAIHDWVEGALSKQMELCNYGQRFQTKLDAFKTQHPDQWDMVQNFYYYAGKHGVRQYDWKRKFIDNTMMMNDAMTELFKDRFLYNYQGDKRDLQSKAYTMATFLRDSCKNFGEAVGATLLMNTFSPTIKKDEEKLEWLRWLNVCDQSGRVNFQRSIGEMYKLASHCESDGWDSYMAARDLYNL